MKKYSYKNLKWDTLEITLPDELANQVIQAEKDYQTSHDYIQKQYYYTWRQAKKSYHMSTYDRKVALWDKTWKQNISIGLIRSFVDVMIAGVNEKPLVFVWTWINKKWIENKENILKTLDYISDISWFHTQLKETMKDWLISWEICMRVSYLKTQKTEKISSIINDQVVIETEETEEKNYPYAKNISIFKVFPDPYNGLLRYVTERDVVDYNNFIEIFGSMIRSKHNKSPFKWQNFLNLLIKNQTWDTSFDDYWNIVNQIHQKVNEEMEIKDRFNESLDNTQNTTRGARTQDEDTQVTEWLIEFKITWYKNRVVLLANWYPAYIWKNNFWFIPYIIKPATKTETRFWEWIPYMLKWLEDVGNSFMNNYFDWARSISNPTMVVNKNLMIDDNELEDSTPWWVIYTENNDNWNAVYRLDKWGLNDFSIMPIITQIAQQITWISEYNLWVAARERTASGALAVTQSSQKRLSPYISTFLEALSIVAMMWLSMIKKFWKKEQFIYVLDEDWGQTAETIKNTDLLWWINLSLNAEWMFGSFQELELQKLISLYQTLAPSWFIQSPDLAKEIIKKSWFEWSKFITAPWEWVIPENLKQDPNSPQPTPNPDSPQPNTVEDPTADIWDLLKWLTNPQINLGNQWNGNPANPNN